MERPDEIQRELALEQAIGAQLDGLVRLANRTVLLLRPETNLKESQLRNVVNVAGEGSIEALLNFIRYQIARERAWQDHHLSDVLRKLIEQGAVPATFGTRDFGHQVIEDIRDEVYQAAQRAVAAAAGQLGGKADAGVLFKEAYPRMAEQYLGYLNRAFYYYTRVKDGSKELEIALMRKEPGHVAI